ncbi:hypothetical protein GCM10011506_35990 [Marivirga lumbricoides]|uniref:Uncharacterized protein n=1 Tax=Marivirga lumbricoides TaxID=1046115 RepID=A0A2T4DR19_9BACT|nr:hypothetical protein C9994_08380 [Marivirga lumbricoides]GGC47229.1 hypothetical protein GCM10011506_35990 [Marivirga lumbricoides]
MANYWVNKHTNTNPHNNHEVHKEGCQFMPSDKIYVGDHANCDSALIEARKHYTDVDGCSVCSNECHKK